MRICAAIAWYDETVEFLYRSVTSLEGLVDEIVAIDGAWELFPDGTPASAPDQEEAVWAAARAIGIPVRVKVPDRVWASQVEKRAALMELAGEHSEWVLVVDADEYVAHCDADVVRAGLAATDVAVAYVSWRNLNQTAETMPGTTPVSGLNRRLFRAGTTVRIVHSGYFYEGRSVLVTDDAIDFRECLAMEHDNINRGAERNARAREYRYARQREGVENWVNA